jgi:hypothetical protein
MGKCIEQIVLKRSTIANKYMKCSTYTAGRNINYCSHYVNQYEVSSKKLKIELSLLSIQLKNHKSEYNRDVCIPIFKAALITIAKLWNQPR